MKSLREDAIGELSEFSYMLKDALRHLPKDDAEALVLKFNRAFDAVSRIKAKEWKEKA